MGPPAFTAITRAHSAADTSQKLLRVSPPNSMLRGAIPALLTRMCSPPICAMVRATASSASRGDVTSTTCVITHSSPPISRRSLDDCPSQSGLMSIIDTRAPARTSASVILRPSPIGLAAPVTIAILPSSGRSCIGRVSSKRK